MTMKKIAWWVPFLLMLLLVIMAILRDGGERVINYRQTYRTSSLSSRAIGWPAGPNLSTCNITLTMPIDWGGHYVNCCPSQPDSDQPISDFEFPSRSSPVRLRRPAHRLHKETEYLAKYNKAVAIMKQLPPDHPHSWHRQANIHCLYCTGSYDRAHDTSTPFNPHYSWLFFPFHRYYVYFHERIIGKLIGDETFALPYWSWDSPEGMPIPSIYMEGSLHDEERERSHLPPKVADLNYDRRESGMSPADQIATNLALMYSHMVSGATKPELFMGYKMSQAGTIESAPHNTLHWWVGGDMFTFYAAARDPVFYAHHANIDRMWELWQKGHGYRGSEPEFDDPQWLDSYFYFYDENLKLVRVNVRDSIDMDKLRYAYEEIDLKWLNARPKSGSRYNIIRTHENLPTSSNKSENILRMSTDKEGPWTLEKTVRVRVTRLARSRTTSTDREEVIVVHGISINSDMYVKFDIYINVLEDDDVAMLSPRSREFAGCFVKMKGGDRMMMNGGKQDMKLGISEILKDLEADEDESIWVSLVPTRAPGTSTGNYNITTTVDRISIEYIV